MGWLEGEHLAALCERRLELAQRRSGARRQYELSGLVIDDTRIVSGAQHLALEGGPVEIFRAAALNAQWRTSSGSLANAVGKF